MEIHGHQVPPGPQPDVSGLGLDVGSSDHDSRDEMMAPKITTVGLIGSGAIGRVLTDQLSKGNLPGMRLAGVLRNHPSAKGEVSDLKALLEEKPDLVVEAAGQQAVRQYAEPVLQTGTDLVILSVGALCDPHLEQRIQQAPGRLIISTGAISGVDGLKALQQTGTLHSVNLISTTLPQSFIQAWMDEDQQRRIQASDSGVVSVFKGTARDAAAKFPAIANVAATVGLASLGLDEVQVELRADSAAQAKTHEIDARAEFGDLYTRTTNRFSSDNPRTSAITPFSVLRFLRDLRSGIVVGV